MTHFRALATASVLALAACAPPKPTPYLTPSGQPEVTIEAPAAAVRDSLAAYMIGLNFAITRSDQYNLVAQARVLETPLPIMTLWYTLAPTSTGTRVLARTTLTHQYGNEDDTYGHSGKIAMIVLSDVARKFVR